MAIVWTDGFDSYSADADLGNNYSILTGGGTIVKFNATAGRTGGGAMQIVNGTASTGYIEHKSSTLSLAVQIPTGVCFWFKAASIPAAAAQLLASYTEGPSFNSGIMLTTSGFLAYNWNGVSAQQTGNINICDNAWHWVEWYDKDHNGGTGKAWVDGVSQWNAAVNAQENATRTRYRWHGISSSITYTVDDFIIFNNTSPAPTADTNMPIGPGTITTLRPSANNSVQFTPDSGSNYARVNEVAADGDTSYVEDGTSTHTDLYDYDNMTFTPTTIWGVSSTTRVKNPGAGSINFKTTCKSSSTSSDGSSTVAPASYNSYKQFLPQDPATSATWTKSGVDAVQFGVKVV